MNEAIKLAIEKGGYEPQVENKLSLYLMSNGEIADIENHEMYAVEDVIDTKAFLLDPQFWQALGKALGWNRDYKIGIQHIVGQSWMIIPAWQYWANHYFNLILTGGDTEAFWKELLKQRV